MRGSRLSERGFLAGSILFVLLFLSNAVLYSRIKPGRFPIPSKMLSLGQTVTPGEYTQLRQAIQTNWEREKAGILQRGPALGTNFDHITATRVRLGALGQAMVVYFGHSPECGATGNCPMEVYVRGPKGYRRVISAGGWGFALLPTGGPVPDLAFYWNMSAFESNAQRFRYIRGQFVAKGGAACTDKSSSVICAPLGNKTVQSPAGGISAAQYNALRRAVEANLEKQLPAVARRASFDNAHAVRVLNMGEVTATVVGLGRCGFNRNCSLSIYARHTRNAEGGYWPLLRNVTGWGVSQGSFETGWSGPPGSLEQRGVAWIAFVIARRLSQSEDELTRYTVPLTVPGPGNLIRGSHLLPEACEIVTPKTGQWPTRWDAAALVARPGPCFKAPSTAKVHVPAADTTNVSAALQDSSGTVRAIGPGNPNHLYRWQTGGWNEAASPVPGLEPLDRLRQLSDCPRARHSSRQVPASCGRPHASHLRTPFADRVFGTLLWCELL